MVRLIYYGKLLVSYISFEYHNSDRILPDHRLSKYIYLYIIFNQKRRKKLFVIDFSTPDELYISKFCIHIINR